MQESEDCREVGRVTTSRLLRREDAKSLKLRELKGRSSSRHLISSSKSLCRALRAKLFARENLMGKDAGIRLAPGERTNDQATAREERDPRR